MKKKLFLITTALVLLIVLACASSVFASSSTWHPEEKSGNWKVYGSTDGSNWTDRNKQLTPNSAIEVNMHYNSGDHWTQIELTKDVTESIVYTDGGDLNGHSVYINLNGHTLTAESGKPCIYLKDFTGYVVVANGTLAGISGVNISYDAGCGADKNYGGCVYLNNCSDVQFKNINLTNNNNTDCYAGGAIAAYKSKVTLYAGANIKNCTAKNGGAVYLYQSTFNFHGTMKHCRSNGGTRPFIYAIGNSTVEMTGKIENTTLSANTAWDCGIVVGSGSKLTMSGDACIDGSGSAPFRGVWAEGQVTMKDNAVIQNCNAGDEQGGGVCVCQSGNFTSEYGEKNVLVTRFKNCKASKGAAIYLQTGAAIVAGISSCSAGSDGGSAIYADTGAGTYALNITELNIDKNSLANSAIYISKNVNAKIEKLVCVSSDYAHSSGCEDHLVYIAKGASLTLDSLQVSHVYCDNSYGLIYNYGTFNFSPSSDSKSYVEKTLFYNSGFLANMGTANIGGDISFNTAADNGGLISNTGTLNIDGTLDIKTWLTAGLKQGGVLFNSGTANISGKISMVCSLEYEASEARYGAAVYNAESGNIELDCDLTIYGFTADSCNGSAIYNCGTISVGNKLNIKKCGTVNNIGVIYNDNGTIEIKSDAKVVFENNTAGVGTAYYGYGKSLLNVLGTVTIDKSESCAAIALYSTGDGAPSLSVTGVIKSNYEGDISDASAPAFKSFIEAWAQTSARPQIELKQGGKISGIYSKENAVIFLSYSDLTMSDKASIVNCKTGNGGGAINARSDSTVLITDESKIENVSTAVCGGAVNASSSVVTVSGSAVLNTKASGEGGAIYLDSRSGLLIYASPVISGKSGKSGGGVYICKGADYKISGSPTFSDCSAALDGGALCAEADFKAEASIKLTSCSAVNYGGAIKANNVSIKGKTVISQCRAKQGGAIYASKEAVLNSMTISGCSAVASSGNNGGGVFASSKVDLINTGIYSCTAAGSYGGAILSNTINLSGTSIISGCSADQGGAIYAYGPVTFTDNSIIQNCSATHNGGAIVSYSQSATININVSASGGIRNCSSGNNGGAIFLSHGSKSSGAGIILSGNSVLSLNTANGGGGTIYCINADVIAEGDVKIKGRSSTDADLVLNAWRGGGVYMQNGVFNISGNASITLESASNAGGAVYLADGSFLYVSGNAVLEGCSYLDAGKGYKGIDGGAVYAVKGSVIDIGGSCQITGYAARGGGLYIDGKASMTGGTVSSCTATTGGGLYAGPNADISLSGSKFALNQCSAKVGGSIYAEGGKLIITEGKYTGTVAAKGNNIISVSGGWFKKKVEYPASGYVASDYYESSPYGSKAPYTVFASGSQLVISFIRNQEEGKDEVKTQVITYSAFKDIAFTLPGEIFTSSSYTLTGWRGTATGGAKYTTGASIMPTTNASFYAAWTVIQGSTRTLNYVDESNYNINRSFTTTENRIQIDPPAFRRPGFTIRCWNTKADGSGVDAIEGGYIKFGNQISLTLYAIWESNTEIQEGNYKIIYSDPSSYNENFSYYGESSSMVVVNANFQREGYNFDCWNDRIDGTGSDYQVGSRYNFGVTQDKTVTLYAKWKLKSVVSSGAGIGEYHEESVIPDVDPDPEDDQVLYTVYYYNTDEKNDDGSYSNYFFQYESKEYITAERNMFAAKSGYKLKGWSTTNSGVNVNYETGDDIQFFNKDEVKLYTVWTVDYDDIRSEEEADDDTDYYKQYHDEKAEEEEDDKKTEYTDVEEDSWYSEAIRWSIENEIAEGTGGTTFSPNADCPRSELITFIWRTMGKPNPTITSCPFTDLNGTESYYKAVLWAYEKGLVKGTGNNKFEPNMVSTRAQVTTILYRLLDGSGYKYTTNPFTDVESGSWYAEAIEWAYQYNIVEGVTLTKFAPTTKCSRSMIVTLLYRCVSNRIIVTDESFA